MRVPQTVSMIYEEILRCSSTTVIIPSFPDALTRYEHDPHNFVHEKLGFKIYAPEGWVITRNATAAMPQPQPDGVVSILILFEKSTLFRPKIELLIESIGDVNFMGYFQQRLNDLRTSGIELLRHHIDEQFQVVTFELMQNKPGTARTFQIHKYFIRNGKAYTIRVSELNPEYTDQEPKIVNDIKKIVKSLAFIERMNSRPKTTAAISFNPLAQFNQDEHGGKTVDKNRAALDECSQ